MIPYKYTLLLQKERVIAFLSNDRYITGIMSKSVRRPNFTMEEEVALADGIRKRQELIFGKFEGATVSKQTKNTAWLEILAEVNAVGPVGRDDDRTLNEVMTKNKNMRSATKKVESKNRKEINKTGGGKANIIELTESQRLTLQTIPESCISGIEGGIDLHESPGKSLRRLLSQKCLYSYLVLTTSIVFS